MISIGPLIRLDDTAGIKRLLEICANLSERAADDPQFRQSAAGADVPAIFRLVRDQIRYRFDPRDVELIIEPAELLRRTQNATAEADCEDIATLVAAIAIVNGIPARLVAYGTGKRWYHVAAELKSHGRWIALDPVAGRYIDSRPTLGRESSGPMTQVMVEGVSGWWDVLTAAPAEATRFGKALIDPKTWEAATTAPARAIGGLVEGVTSVIEALSPGFEAYGQYRAARELRKAAVAPVLPAAAVTYMAPPAPAAARTLTVLPMPAGPPPAPAFGIDTKTLVVGGALLAALLILKGK